MMAVGTVYFQQRVLLLCSKINPVEECFSQGLSEPPLCPDQVYSHINLFLRAEIDLNIQEGRFSTTFKEYIHHILQFSASPPLTSCCLWAKSGDVSDEDLDFFLLLL